MAVSHRLLSTKITPIKLSQILLKLSQNQRTTEKLAENLLFDGGDFWPHSHLKTDEKLPYGSFLFVELHGLGPTVKPKRRLKGLLKVFKNVTQKRKRPFQGLA